MSVTINRTGPHRATEPTGLEMNVRTIRPYCISAEVSQMTLTLIVVICCRL